MNITALGAENSNYPHGLMEWRLIHVKNQITGHQKRH